MSDEIIIKTCEHIRTNGDPCGSPALTDRHYCHFHDRFYDLTELPGCPDYVPPVLEDPLSVQLFITQIAKAHLCAAISPLEATQLLNFARLAMQNLRLAKSN